MLVRLKRGNVDVKMDKRSKMVKREINPWEIKDLNLNGASVSKQNSKSEKSSGGLYSVRVT